MYESLPVPLAEALAIADAHAARINAADVTRKVDEADEDEAEANGTADN